MATIANDAIREMALSEQIQNAKAELLALLTEEEKTTKRTTKGEERVYPWTFEDSARSIADSDDPRANDVKAKLRALQNAVNQLWIALHSVNAPEKLYRAWKRKNGRLAKLIPREDVESEILMMIRDVILKIDLSRGVPFIYAAPAYLFSNLTDWAKIQTADVKRPRTERRKDKSGIKDEVSLDTNEAKRRVEHDGYGGALSYEPDYEADAEMDPDAFLTAGYR